jgi:hypothetical protein
MTRADADRGLWLGPMLAVGVAVAATSCTRTAPPPDTASPGARPAQLTNRIWIGAVGNPPGAMLIFLSDGTLVQDSCWETYRLSRWRALGGDALQWEEDTVEIDATIVALDGAELTLRLDLPDGALEQAYVAATVPYVCPDMPR